MDTQPSLGILRLDTGEWHTLLQDAADARYVPTGHIVFIRQGRLLAVRFDPARMKVAGEPFPVVDHVIQALAGGDSDHNSGAGQFGISDTGSLIYGPGGIVPELMNSLVWVDRRGMEEPVTARLSPYHSPRISPDGQRIAYVTSGRERRVWVYDLATGTNNPLTKDGWATRPIWSPDGKQILFSWEKSLAFNLFWQPSDGSSSMVRLTEGKHDQYSGSWSRDGKSVAFVEENPDTGTDIFILDAQSGRVTPFLNSRFQEGYPDFSPDGRWIAYASNESGRFEVYVRPFPGPNIKHPVSSEGGIQPLWAKDRKQLFYRWEDQVWVVDVRTDGGFATGKPRLLFDRLGYIMAGPVRSYDVSLDGQRFVMVKLDQRKPTPLTEMVLVQNWFEELKRLVPAGKK